MGQQTNISFYLEGNVVPSPDQALQVLRSLGVDEGLAFVTRYKTLYNAWEHRLDGSLPQWELNGRRVTLPEAVQYIEPTRETVVSIRKSEDGIARRFMVEAWQAVPKDLAADFVFSNNDCTFGMHDIFGMVSQAEEVNTYIARSPFSVKFWGYRCPSDIDRFREVVENLPVLTELTNNLSRALKEPVKTSIYMNL
jgi:hypothetical protein